MRRALSFRTKTILGIALIEAVLVNLGSPASTSVADVRSYLNQFLIDRKSVV